MSAQRATRSQHVTSAIHKGAAIVEALVTEHRISEIAVSTGLPVSTVHRILQELIALGWVRQGEERDYALGARLLSLVGQAKEEAAVIRVAGPILQRLR
ncbi:MAG: helix-turn-helix domain-containing protein, partial [Actinobacteria bacterium]|nr:helix-turn-helix domain-containing protein [Actinomycetota bacterium]